MTTTRWPTVLYALLDTLRAQPGYRSPGADVPESLVLVLDGPEWEMTADTGDLYLVVGGSIDDESTSGDARQKWGPIGGRPRDDEGTVLCQAVAQLGGLSLPDASLAGSVPQDTWRSLTASAFAMIATVENILRADPALGITGVQRMVAELGSVDAPHRYFTDTGAVVSILFGVDYKTRI